MIDTTQIPQHEAESLASATLKATRAYFAIPENQVAFEKWLAEEKAKAAETNN